MERYDGDRPQNARIRINYKGKKPKVRFSYPMNKKDSRTIGNMMLAVLMGWILINLPLLLYISNSQETLQLDYEPYNKYNISNYSEFINYYTQQERLDFFYEYYNQDLKNKSLDFFMKFNFFQKFMLFYIILGGLIIYFPFKKKWDKLYPDYQALTSRKKYKKFNNKD